MYFFCFNCNISEFENTQNSFSCAPPLVPIETVHHTFLESGHPEVTKNLYYALFTRRSQIFLGSSSWAKSIINIWLKNKYLVKGKFYLIIYRRILTENSKKLINQYMYSVGKWPSTLQKSCVVHTARCLKYVRPFFNNWHDRDNFERIQTINITLTGLFL